MAYEMGEKQGVLFPQKAEGKQPDYSGKFMIDGKLIKLVGWSRQGKSGPFISFKVDEPKRQSFEAQQDKDIDF